MEIADSPVLFLPCASALPVPPHRAIPVISLHVLKLAIAKLYLRG